MTTTAIPPLTANVRKTPGGWLATPSDGAFPQVGVMGDTAEEALARLLRARDEWRALLTRPVPTDG